MSRDPEIVSIGFSLVLRMVTMVRVDRSGSFRGEILLLILVDGLFGFAVGFSSPSVAPLIVAIGVSITFVGQAQTLGGLGATFLRLPIGVLIDRIGRKPFIIIGGLVTLVGFFSYSFATYWVLLGAGIVLVSLDFAIRGTASYAALGHATTTQGLGKIFSLDLGVTESAATLAPLLGGFLATSLGFPRQMIFITSAVLVAVALGVVLVGYKPEPVHRIEGAVESWWGILRPDKRLIPLLVVVALDSVAWRISFPFWALYIFKEMKSTPEQLGIALAISAGIPALTGFTLGSKLDKLGGRPFLAASEWAAIGCFLPLLLGWRPEFAYISAVFAGFVYSLWMPALNAHIVLHYGREKYGQTLGTLALVAGAASAASPILGGWMWDNISPQSPFILNLALAIIIGFIIWFKIKEPS
ncbi:MAG: MFS transporter [Candidatus Bathyarchaeia archaeon]|jgi:MFS family permease